MLAERGCSPEASVSPLRSEASPACPAPALHQPNVLDARFRRGVAAVSEAVDDEVADGEAPGELDESLEVPEAGVHATVGDEPDQVDAL